MADIAKGDGNEGIEINSNLDGAIRMGADFDKVATLNLDLKPQ